MAEVVPVPEQREAIDDRERDLFLTAGAGTGKTSVLVERFCDAVCARSGPDGEVGVEKILAFTFTDRAAGELKRRIRAELHDRAEVAVGPEEAGRLRRLAREAESAWISTIHAFCQRLLASHPLAAGLDPRFRVLDATAAARVTAQAFDAAFRRHGEQGGEAREEMAAAFRVAGLREIVTTAHDELRSRGAPAPELPELGRPNLRAAIAEVRGAATEALAATAEAKRGKAEENRDRMAAALARTVDGETLSEEEVAAWCFESGAKDFQVPAVERYHEATKALECRLVEERFAQHYEHLRELLRLYAIEYRERKEARSALDFEDLQLGARALLETRPDLRRRYAGQFAHLMIDEFQDTNELQLAIVGLLHRPDGQAVNRLFTVGDEFQSIYAFRHADVEVFRRQQREFREAPDDRAGVRELLGNFRSRPEVLGVVNRLGRHLFEDFNELTVGAAPEGELRGGGPAVELLVTDKEGWDEEGVALEVSADERAQRWRVAEGRFLARRLRELAENGFPRGGMVVLLRSFSYVEAYEQALEDEGLAPYVVGGRGYWSKQQVTDVRNLLSCIANPLDDMALYGALASPCCGVAPDTLWLLEQARGGASLWSAVRWLYGPDAAAVATDRDEPDEGLAEWRERAEDWARHVPEADTRAVRDFVARLLVLRELAPRLALEELIDRAITDVGYDLALLMMRPHGERRMANVRKLMRLAREFEAAEGRDLRGFLDFVEGEAEIAGREAEAAVQTEDHEGVRVMTVHAAKGLEFPLVAVADLGRQPLAGFPPALRLQPEATADSAERNDSGAMRVGLRLARLGRKGKRIFEYEELQRLADELSEAEERRILHVAMTRAEERLVLSGATELSKLDRAPNGREPLIGPVLRGLAWDGEAEAVAIEPPRPREGLDESFEPADVPVRTCRPTMSELSTDTPKAASEQAASSPAAGAQAQLFTDGEPPARLLDPELAPPATIVAPPVTQLSYSAIALYERCGYRFYAERVLGMRPRLPVPAGRPRPDAAAGVVDDELTAAELDSLAGRYARGRVVHQLLERSAREGWSMPSPEHARDLLRREGAPEAAAERALGQVRSFLASETRAELADARRLRPELPFAFRLGAVVVRGEIDLLADMGDELVVVDYKSDALDGADPADHMDRYEVQRRIYALAALRRHARPVRVLYVFLDRPDAVVETPFEPDDVDALTERLGELTHGIVERRFEVTDEPERRLCFDCPARERLCVHGPERTLRDRSDATAV